MNATVTKNHVATVNIVLQQAGNGSSVTVDSPFIAGISLSDGAPHYGESVLMAASVKDATTAPSLLTYAWSATCDGSPVTGFVPSNSASTTFTPDCKGTASITLKVSDGKIDSSVTFPLTYVPQGTGVTVTLNRFPVVSGFTVFQAQLPLNGETDLGVTATDDETLSYGWSSTCGVLSVITGSNGGNHFTAPNVAGDCTVTVAVTDGLGGKSTRSVILHVGNFSPTIPVFNTIPATIPPSLVSQPFQAQQTSEFGDYISLSPGTGRHAVRATVVMVTWALAANPHFPITLNLYSVSGSVLANIGHVTQSFDLPARPAADPSCSGGRWLASDGCHNGYAVPISFDLSGITLPDSFAYGIAYNTQTYGVTPIGADGPWNSLNVGLIGDGSTASSTTPSVGSDPNPDALLRDWVTSGHAPGLVSETGWTGYAPAVEFFAY
jgi:hypothetical protein